MATGIQVVFDCVDPLKQAGFWAEALHYLMPDPPGDFATWEDWARAQGLPEEHWNDAAAIEDPDGEGPRLFFQKVPEGKVVKNRVHLDLNVSGGRAVVIDERKTIIWTEVERLKALGADDHRGAMEKDGEFWVRMNDPEGNEFCIQ
jgi:Glyoxalase-like domain